MSPLRTHEFPIFSAFIGLAVGVWACSGDPQPSPNGGSGGSVGTAGGGSLGTAGTAITTGGQATVSGAANGGTFVTGTAGLGGSAGNAGAGTAGAAGSAGSGGGGTGGGGGKAPMCLTNGEQDGIDRAKNNYIECDVEDQAIDFDVMANYDAGRKPGYDPAMTPVTFTDFGTALTGSEVQLCHPYCYKGNLTIGLDLTAASAKSMQGEILFGFPATVAPIVAPAGRASLGWVFIDGPALPAGGKLTLQMVLKSTDKGLIVAKETKMGELRKWIEFRYFPIDSTFDKADLVNITHIGFRVTLTGAAAPDWHGVIYADHFQLRK